MNKELEEAAEKEYPKLIVKNPSCNGYDEPNHIDINEECRNAFVEGAELMQGKMYSEEDLREALFYALYLPKTDGIIVNTSDSIVRKIIEKFKKK